MVSRGESKNENKGILVAMVKIRKNSANLPKLQSEEAIRYKAKKRIWNRKKTIGLGMVIKLARIDEKWRKFTKIQNPGRSFVMMSRGESKNENKGKDQENY